MTDKKYKIIIDTDPGVDDSACLIYAFFNEREYSSTLGVSTAKSR